MKSECVLYNGRTVPKHGFRAFVYGVDDKSKLVNSWDEFLSAIGSGLWFPNKKDVPEKLKAKKKGGE